MMSYVNKVMQQLVIVRQSYEKQTFTQSSYSMNQLFKQARTNRYLNMVM